MSEPKGFAEWWVEYNGGPTVTPYQVRRRQVALAAARHFAAPAGEVIASGTVEAARLCGLTKITLERGGTRYWTLPGRVLKVGSRVTVRVDVPGE